ncbi:response regulator receiver domain-containing protein [Sphingomonas sp. PP-F2F-A104-K0414]|jgi:two-component system response regulator QseB|nr:response regulator receiver domain-containing protein [Sphingomonas sp. PP-F2F-A104-K0414]TCQ02583.1 response regulator receiver domain-containing protein [Sphingomonas sp. PP-CC-3A-396]
MHDYVRRNSLASAAIDEAMVNVLFIEDDRMNRRVVKDMLDVAGVTMVEAESAERGLEIIDEQDFAMILVDLRMPGMDGVTAIKHIRARDDAKGRVPIIVVTADIAPDLRQRCLVAGADDVIFKPVAMDSLFDAMGRILARDAEGEGMIG